MDSETRSYYLDLYKLSVDEVHKYHVLHHQRVVYFSGLVTTILGAASLALLRSTVWQHYVFSAAALVLLVLVCQVGRAGIKGAHQLLLESISVKAKLEQVLGMTENKWHPIPKEDLKIWADEPLVPPRHLQDRRRFKAASEKWLNHRLEKSDQRWTSRFLLYAEGLAVGLLVVTVVLILDSGLP